MAFQTMYYEVERIDDDYAYLRRKFISGLFRRQGTQDWM